MGCLGVHFAITEAQAHRLLELAGDDAALVDYVKEQIEPAWDEEFLCETEKAWDALHRTLSDGSLDASRGEPPLNQVFFGGRVLNESDGYFVVLLEPAQVADVARAIAPLDEAFLRRRYFSLEFGGYQGQKGEQDFEHAWSWFGQLPAFFEKAAAAKRYVIFTVDQ